MTQLSSAFPNATPSVLVLDANEQVV
jgi:hypothetical protein